MSDRAPNVLVILTDQWRAQATGYAGDPNAHTPTLDSLAAESTNYVNAVSGAPVCCPSRASLITGQYPLQHGVYINDVELVPHGPTIAELYRDAGYRTGYIGKWHLYGSPDGHYGRRGDPVPRDKRFGFDYWKGAECTHNYNESFYYADDGSGRRVWPGYDAEAQTEDACAFIAAPEQRPYLLFLSFGPPHFPLHTAPERYRAKYAGAPITLRGNVSDELAETSAEALRGYYAHIAALDDCIARLLNAVERSGQVDDTIIVFTSDHGDMMGSQGIEHDVKVTPWEEAIRIPLLVRYPRRFGIGGRVDETLINMPDVMPTLLGLSGISAPPTVSGVDVNEQRPTSAFLGMPVPILWARTYGLAEYRGVRNERYTYIRSISGPWLLYDNVDDPLQLRNLIEEPKFEPIRRDLADELGRWLDRLGDDFLPADSYLKRDGLTHYYEVNNPVGSSEGPNNQWRSTIPGGLSLEEAAPRRTAGGR